MTTPNAMPRKKVDRIHVDILAAAVATKSESWDHKTIDPETADQKKPSVIKTKVTHSVPRPGIAGNISDENIERMAGRWLQ